MVIRVTTYCWEGSNNTSNNTCEQSAIILQRAVAVTLFIFRTHSIPPFNNFYPSLHIRKHASLSLYYHWQGAYAHAGICFSVFLLEGYTGATGTSFTELDGGPRKKHFFWGRSFTHISIFQRFYRRTIQCGASNGGLLSRHLQSLITTLQSLATIWINPGDFPKKTVEHSVHMGENAHKSLCCIQFLSDHFTF